MAPSSQNYKGKMTSNNRLGLTNYSLDMTANSSPEGKFRVLRNKTTYSLICFYQLVESQQASIPATTVLRLEVHVDLVHYSSPTAREVMFNDSSQTHGELGA